jgi:hypothetical protein
MRAFVLIVLLLLANAATAAPVTLKCTDQSGQPAANLEVDVVATEMRWGVSQYRITQMDARYISGVQVTSPDEVGGEIWVLDRVSGQYTRAAVGILATQFKDGRPVDPMLQAATYSGVCKAAVL